MALNENCEVLRDGKWVPETIEEALAKRSQRVREQRRCIACREETLVATKKGRDGKAAHFEHRPWNKACPRRDQSWEEERLACETLQDAGASKGDAWAKVKLMRKQARNRGTSFSGLSKRARAVGVHRDEFLDWFTKDYNGLVAEIEKRETQP
jgi:hypothetical protein